MSFANTSIPVPLVLLEILNESLTASSEAVAATELLVDVEVDVTGLLVDVEVEELLQTPVLSIVKTPKSLGVVQGV